jgi:hypothetical protein
MLSFSRLNTTLSMKGWLAAVGQQARRLVVRLALAGIGSPRKLGLRASTMRALGLFSPACRGRCRWATSRGQVALGHARLGEEALGLDGTGAKKGIASQ